MRGTFCCLALFVLVRGQTAGEPVNLQGIVGRVLDTRGEPISGAAVWLLRPVARDGHTEYLVESTVVTDRSGDYRFDRVSGNYLVRAAGVERLREYVGEDPPEPDSHATFAPVYFGGASLPEKATLLVASFPSTRADFRLELRHGHTIQGVIANSTRWQQKSAQLFREGEGAQANRVSIGLATGRFRIDDVLDGRYGLLVTQTDDHGRKAYAESQVEVAGNDVGGIALTVTPGHSVQFALRFDLGRAEDDAWVWTKVRLCPPERFPRICVPRCYAGQYTAANGEHELHDVPEGRYRVSVDVSPFYLKSALAGGVDLIQNPEILVDGNTPPMELVLGTDGGIAAGTFPSSVFEKTEVLLVSESGSGLPRMAEPYDHNDPKFDFQGVPAGVYRLHLLKKAPEIDYATPEILRFLKRTGERVEVKPKASVQVELRHLSELKQ